MTDYKLAPFEPTPEMVEAAEDAYMPFGDMDLAIRMAILAAPDVQGGQQPELAKYQPCGCVICTCEHETQCQGCGAKHCGTHPVGQIPGPVYQQPAPDVEALVEALEAALGSFDDWCEGQDPSDIADAIDTFPWVMQARTALSAHRKQETSHDNQ